MANRPVPTVRIDDATLDNPERPQDLLERRLSPQKGKLKVPKRPPLLRKKTREAFQAQSSIHARRKNLEEGMVVGMQVLFLGISVASGPNGSLELGFATHDGTYSNDFATWLIQDDIVSMGAGRSAALAKHIVAEVDKYREKHLCKFLGAGLTMKLVGLSPQLPSMLWLDLDIVPFVFQRDSTPSHYPMRNRPNSMSIDEEADSMARLCLR